MKEKSPQVKQFESTAALIESIPAPQYENLTEDQVDQMATEFATNSAELTAKLASLKEQHSDLRQKDDAMREKYVARANKIESGLSQAAMREMYGNPHLGGLSLGDKIGLMARRHTLDTMTRKSDRYGKKGLDDVNDAFSKLQANDGRSRTFREKNLDTLVSMAKSEMEQDLSSRDK